MLNLSTIEMENEGCFSLHTKLIQLQLTFSVTSQETGKARDRLTKLPEGDMAGQQLQLIAFCNQVWIACPELLVLVHVCVCRCV